MITQGTLSVEEMLRRIPRYEVNNGSTLFKRHYMKQPLVIGAIGTKGSGKSGTVTVITVIDDLLEGLPVWSNLAIKVEYDIADTIAQKYGLPHGGSVEFHSKVVDKQKLLRFDPEFHDGTLVLDEINVEYAEGRRSQSNVNLWFNDLDQQLRKLNLNLYYSVLHEMWIDPRLREMTDIFIKCEDPAISPEGIMKHTPLGLQTKWTIYDMTGKLTGVTYFDSRKPLAPRYLNLRRWWGVWDTKQRQAKEGGQYTFKREDNDQKAGTVFAGQSDTIQVEDEWDWLDKAITNTMQELQEKGQREISRPELFALLKVPEELRLRVGKKLLYDYGLLRPHPRGGILYYQVPQTNLNKPESFVGEGN